MDWYFPKDTHQKSEGEGDQWDPLKKLDSLTLEMSKNHLIHNFLRNGRLRVKAKLATSGYMGADGYKYWLETLKLCQ